MRTKITLILFLLNAVLFWYIYHNRNEINGRFEQHFVLGPETSNIHTLEIAAAGSSVPVKLERAGDSSWLLTQPLQWPANEFAVNRIISELQQLHPYASFAVADITKAGQSLADYGLEKPPLVLTFTTGTSAPSSVPARNVTLKIGDPTKVGNRLYVLSPDGQTIHVVNRSLAESLALRIEDLRSDTLFTIPVFEVRTFKLQPPAPATATSIDCDNNRWFFKSPFPSSVRAGKSATVLAINELQKLRVKSFLDPRAVESTRTGLSSPELQITLIGNNRRETLLLGAQVDAAKAPAEDASRPAEFYAKMEDKTPVFVVTLPNTLLETLRNAQETLRDTHVLDIEPSNINAIALSAPNLPQITLQRLEATSPNPSAAAWQVVRHDGDKGPQTFPADRERVDRLIQKLAQLTAERFVDDAPSASALEDFGFNRPAREITLSFARAQTSTSGTSATLQIGASSGAEPITYAKLTSQNYVYRVASAILSDTPVSLLAYRDRLIRELPAGAQITGLKLTDLSNNSVLFDTVLPIPESLGHDSARRTAIETLAGQLRVLKAREFLRDEFSTSINVAGEERSWRYRLDVTVSLGGGTGTQTTSSALYFSERAGGTTQYAGAPDVGLVFETEQPLADALFGVIFGPADPGPAQPPAAPSPAPAAEPSSTPKP